MADHNIFQKVIANKALKHFIEMSTNISCINQRNWFILHMTVGKIKCSLVISKENILLIQPKGIWI